MITNRFHCSYNVHGLVRLFRFEVCISGTEMSYAHLFKKTRKESFSLGLIALSSCKAASCKKVPNGLSRCHTKRRIGMTPTFQKKK